MQASSVLGRYSSGDPVSRVNPPITLLFRILVAAFPFLVLYSPLVNFGVGQRRLDEWLVLGFLPLALLNFFTRKAQLRRLCGAYWWALLAILFVYVFGATYSYTGGGWSAGNLRLIGRPVIVIANIVVLRYWLAKARLPIHSALWLLAVALSSAGVLGVFAMSQPEVALKLVETYSPGLIGQDLAFRFNMSWRAMSVFNGYDAASMAYAMGLLVTAYLVQASGWRPIVRYSWMPLFLSTAVSIISSARIGFLAVIAGLLFLLWQSPLVKLLKSLAALVVLVLFLVIALPVVAPRLFPDSVTLERFADVFNIFDLSSSGSIVERSTGVSSVFESQILAVDYPTGVDVFFGFGDDGSFISDVGYVVLFVKYGLVGLSVVGTAIYWMAARGLKLGHLVKKAPMGDTLALPVNLLVPAMVVMFVVGSFKGGLYFLSEKTAECFALIAALGICEVENALKMLPYAATATPKGVQS